MTEENKGYPKGTVKKVISELDTFKLVTKIGVGATGKGVKIVYEDGEYGAKTIKLPEGKFKGKALEVPVNKKLYNELKVASNAYEENDEQKFTLTFVKGDQYWDFQGIEAGEHGVAGIQGQGGASNSGGSGGGYNPSGAIIGKIENWALEMTIANKSAKGKVTLEDVYETLDNFDPELIKKINEAATSIYEEAYNGTSSKSANKAEPEPEEEELGDSDDLDEDCPF